MRDIGTLTGLRGFAALWVCLLHYTYGQTGGFALQVAAKGSWGVVIFFVLSGFILAYVYQEWFREKSKLQGYGRFLLIRFARVYPLHALTLLIAAVLMGVGFTARGPNDTTYTFLLNLLLIHAWGFTDRISWNEPSWSISTEAFCYVFFPFLVVSLRSVSSPRRLMLLAALVAAMALNPYGGVLRAAWWIAGEAFPEIQFAYAVSLTSWTLVFTFGVVLFYVAREARISRVMSDGLVLCGIAVLGLGCALPMPDSGHILAFVSFASALIVVGLYREGVIAQAVFGNPIAIFLGNVSYALYLVHMLLPGAFNGVLLRAGVELWWALLPLGVQIFLAVGVAAGLHFGFERPARYLLRRAAGRDPKIGNGTSGWRIQTGTPSATGRS